jgi:hypothetical protein
MLCTIFSYNLQFELSRSNPWENIFYSIPREIEKPRLSYAYWESWILNNTFQNNSYPRCLVSECIQSTKTEIYPTFQNSVIAL